MWLLAERINNALIGVAHRAPLLHDTMFGYWQKL